MLAELDGSLATEAQYADFPGYWGGMSSERRSEATRFFVHDMSANTRANLDAAGSAVAEYAYAAFGPELRAGNAANPFRFGGRWRTIGMRPKG